MKTLADVAEMLERTARRDIEVASALRIGGKYEIAREHQATAELYAEAAAIIRTRLELAPLTGEEIVVAFAIQRARELLDRLKKP